jgi:hypothetical protein
VHRVNNVGHRKEGSAEGHRLSSREPRSWCGWRVCVESGVGESRWFPTGDARRDTCDIVVRSVGTGRGTGIEFGVTTFVARVDVSVVVGIVEKAFRVGGFVSGNIRVKLVRHHSRLKLVVKGAFIFEVKFGGGFHGMTCCGFLELANGRGVVVVGGECFGVRGVCIGVTLELGCFGVCVCPALNRGETLESGSGKGLVVVASRLCVVENGSLSSGDTGGVGMMQRVHSGLRKVQAVGSC